MRRRTSLAAQQGFTLIELMVAALVLIVGLLSILTIVQSSALRTTLNAKRVAATNFARELTEAARSADYDALTPAGAGAAIRAAGTNLGGGSPWTVNRGTTTYTITVTTCTFDDPADKISSSAPENKCANNPGGATGDANGNDFRRVSFDVKWTWRKKNYTFTQTTLVVNPAGGLGPRIISFTPPGATITSGSNAHFDITTTGAAAVHWNADDGVTAGDADSVSGYTSWKIDWDLKAVGTAGAILDGAYNLGAQAFDDRNIAGDAKVATVRINRSAPLAPKNFAGGHDTRAGDWIDFEWSLNAERDITGYRVYWAGPDKVQSGDDQLVCPASSGMLSNTTTVCRDVAPPAGEATYYAVAYDDTTPAGSPRPGAITYFQVNAPDAQPDAPVGLSATGSSSARLNWSSPGSGSPAFYRVYRDGTTWSDRIGRTASTSFLDTGGTASPHQYWITAVDAKYNESAPLGPVQWTP